MMGNGYWSNRVSERISMLDSVRIATAHMTGMVYGLARPLLFRASPMQAHEETLSLLAKLDRNPAAIATLKAIRTAAFPSLPVTAGGVTLPYPMILAAGFVKGHGFENEQRALTVIRQRENIIPGWRSMPALVGPIEFGSFTRHPRTGNPGVVLWRDITTQSTQNRIGLKNPGAVAAAAFLALHRHDLPSVYGINIATSPGVDDITREMHDVTESIRMFTARGIYPSWFTLNLSCPNTEDDPGANQTTRKAHKLCSALIRVLNDVKAEVGREIPLWVKVGPCLSDEQYAALMRAFHETGVKAVIATNTIPRPTPDGDSHVAGVGGGALHPHSVAAAAALMREKKHHNYTVDVIGCGGIIDPAGYRAYTNLGVSVVQYWSALLYRGPLAAALILNDR